MSTVAQSFEEYRAHLFAVAYRMLVSAMDAEDMVQETYIRCHVASKDEILSLGGLAVDPTGRFVYIADGLNLSAYTIDPRTGALSGVFPVRSAGTRPYSVAIAGP
jgi:DNA-binding beta-propeller fold protein YncE